MLLDNFYLWTFILCCNTKMEKNKAALRLARRTHPNLRQQDRKHINIIIIFLYLKQKKKKKETVFLKKSAFPYSPVAAR